LAASHRQLGSSFIPAATVLEAADARAAETSATTAGKRNPYPLGCTILKACGSHVEIVENALVVPPNWKTFTVIGAPIPNELEEDDTGTAAYSARVAGYPNPPDRRPVVDNQDMITLRLLPHIDDSGIRHDHEGIKVDRGGLTHPINFGLLGDEKLVTLLPPEQQ
jgi:hypothetical protein